MSGFFGFDAVLPERRGQNNYQNAPANSAFHQAQGVDMGGLGATEDIAVYTWGTEEYDGLGDALMEVGDEANDLTFGADPVGTDFQFGYSEPASQKPTASKSRSKKATSADLFASSEADFFTSKKSGSRSRNKDASSSKPTTTSHTPTPLAPKIKTMEEIEAEQFAMMQARAQPPPAAKPLEPTSRPMTMEELERQLLQQSQPQSQQTSQPLTMEEIEASMRDPMRMDEMSRQVADIGRLPTGIPPQGLPGMPQGPNMYQQQPPQHHPQPQQPQLPPPGYPQGPPIGKRQQGPSQQELHQMMFPPLGSQAQPQQRPQGHGQGFPPQPQAEQGGEQIGAELERKIMETELAEARRRRKAMKIASMSKYNDIMTGGDKEFITRIQLSQLVTSDPYASDFYAQVFSALARAKLAAAGVAQENSGPTVLQVGSDGRGLGVGATRGPNRGTMRLKDSAMQRMTMQVKRIVDNAKNRTGDKAPSASLQGVLGKTVLRPSTAAPRPALQVASSQNLTSLLTPGHAHGTSTGRRAPLTNKQVLLRIESLYESVMDVEHLRRNQPPPPPTEAQMQEYGISPEQAQERALMANNWSQAYQEGIDKLWSLLMVQEPLEISNPHPFISLLTPIKGQRVFGRILRNFSPSQSLTVLILLLACFPQLDVVKNPQTFSSVAGSAALAEKKRKEMNTESFLAGVVPVIVGIVGKLDLKMISGLISLCVDRWDAASVMATRPGVALFTILMSRAEILKQIPAGAPPEQQAPSQADLDQWNATYVNLVRHVIAGLPAVFPSTQAQAAAFGPEAYLIGNEGKDAQGMLIDQLDGQVWGMISAMAVHAQPDEQTALVSGLREKIIHTVQSVKRGRVSEERGALRLRNVNLFLNLLGLDAGMIDA